jgi:hypothetical protein
LQTGGGVLTIRLVTGTRGLPQGPRRLGARSPQAPSGRATAGQLAPPVSVKPNPKEDGPSLPPMIPSAPGHYVTGTPSRNPISRESFWNAGSLYPLCRRRESVSQGRDLDLGRLFPKDRSLERAVILLDPNTAYGDFEPRRLPENANQTPFRRRETPRAPFGGRPEPGTARQDRPPFGENRDRIRGAGEITV